MEIPSFINYIEDIKKNPRKLFADVSDFIFGNWMLILGLYCYYHIAKNLFRQSLLLLQDGQNGVPFYYNYLIALTDPAIDILSFWLPIFFTGLVFSGVYLSLIHI